jgi:hypothetical protein
VLGGMEGRGQLLCWEGWRGEGNFCAGRDAGGRATSVLGGMQGRGQLLCWKGCRGEGNFCAGRDAGERATSDPILNLKYFIQAVKFRCPTQKSLQPPIFRHSPVAPWGTYCPR